MLIFFVCIVNVYLIFLLNKYLGEIFREEGRLFIVLGEADSRGGFMLVGFCLEELVGIV